MTSSVIKFVHEDHIIEVNNPDPNETLLNYIRTKLKKPAPRKAVLKVVVEHAPLY